MNNPIVLIPARLGSTRLPNKPLAPIAGKPMIVHVVERAREAAIGPVCVACAEPEILEVVENAGARAVLTDPDLPSGTDRIFEALKQFDPERKFDVVVNLQGDWPTVAPAVIRDALAPLTELGTDISTLVNPIDNEEDAINPSMVKAIISPVPTSVEFGRALYFTRATAPYGPGPLFHHIGIYGFTRTALEHFAQLPPSPLEQRERLEQLRALENGMTIGVRITASVPFGVDTPEHLERARTILEAAPN